MKNFTILLRVDGTIEVDVKAKSLKEAVKIGESLDGSLYIDPKLWPKDAEEVSEMIDFEVSEVVKAD